MTAFTVMSTPLFALSSEVIPLPDVACTDKANDESSLFNNPNHPACVKLKGIINDTEIKKPIFEKQFCTTLTLTKLSSNHLNQESGVVFKDSAGKIKWMTDVFLADCHGKIIAKIPKGYSIMEVTKRYRRKIFIASYLCVVIKRKVNFWSKWKIVSGEKIKFTRSGELFSIIEESPLQ